MISFTTDTDGRLPEGTSLAQAIAETDELSGGYPMYYMINCAHPEHLTGALEGRGTCRERIRGLRANAFRRSHAELDESADLDIGDRRSSPASTPASGRLAPARGGRVLWDRHRHVEAIGAARRGLSGRRWRAGPGGGSEEGAQAASEGTERSNQRTHGPGPEHHVVTRFSSRPAARPVVMAAAVTLGAAAAGNSMLSLSPNPDLAAAAGGGTPGLHYRYGN